MMRITEKHITRVAHMITYGMSKEDIRNSLIGDLNDSDIFLVYAAAEVYLQSEKN